MHALSKEIISPITQIWILGQTLLQGIKLKYYWLLALKINSDQISEHFQTSSIYVHVKIASIQEINR